MEIQKTFTFDAGHRLQEHDGKCAYLHGHRYECCIQIEGRVQDSGMVVDFSNVKDPVMEMFDHKLILEEGDELIEKLGEQKIFTLDSPPTVEVIATQILDRIEKEMNEDGIMPQSLSIELYETESSKASVSRGLRWSD